MKNLRGLFVGGRQCWSLGRVAFWLVFGVAIYRWLIGQDIPPGHEAVLTIILLYILGGKVASKVGTRGITVDGPIEASRK
jgi:hypothetical protein